MKNLDVKAYLYHGIVDWENYNNGKLRQDFCLNKLESILQFKLQQSTKLNVIL